jgi:hypothetical protein
MSVFEQPGDKVLYSMQSSAMTADGLLTKLMEAAKVILASDDTKDVATVRTQGEIAGQKFEIALAVYR